MSMGGVARNIAEAAHRTSVKHGHKGSTLLIAPVGSDNMGILIRQDLSRIGMRVDGLITLEGNRHRSAACCMHLDSQGNLVSGVADMDITSEFSAEKVCLPAVVDLC
jgi:pseudouridylate synthase / pseudouridine kinase